MVRKPDSSHFIVELSQWPSFERTTDTLADADIEKRGLEELALRFFAAKNGQDFYAGHVANWLDKYMEIVLLKQKDFDFNQERQIFRRVFDAVDAALGEGAFCKYKDNHPVGGLAPAHYEAVAIAFANRIDQCEATDPKILKERITVARQTPAFRENVGPGANNKTKLRGRIEVIEQAIAAAV